MRFIRDYQIIIQTPEGTQIEINPPITATINITRNTLASANSCTVEIINLKAGTRSQIYKDRFAISDYWQMIIRAGYRGQLYEIFRGNIYEAWSSKQGTEWKTSIEGMDGMYAIQNGVTSRSYNAGTNKTDIIGDVIKDMPNVFRGVITGDLNETTERGSAYLGQSSEILEGVTDNSYFIDNETVNVLSDNQYLGGLNVLLLDSSLRFATPRRRENLLETSTLFTPQANVGGLAEIRGGELVYAGQYKILGLSHNVTISQADPGQAVTNLTLDAGTQALEAIG